LLKIEKQLIKFFVSAAAWAFIFFRKKTKQKKLHPANSHTQNSQNHLFMSLDFLLMRILIVFKQCRLL